MSGSIPTILDYVMLAVVAVSALVGIVRGLIRELLSLLSWVVSIWVAWYYAGALSTRLEDLLNSPQLQYVVALAAIFVVSLLALSMMSMLVSKMLRLTGTAGTDRSLGAVFGLLRGAAIVLGAVFILNFTPAASQSWYRNAALLPYLMPVYEYLDEQDFMQSLDALPETAGNAAPDRGRAV